MLCVCLLVCWFVLFVCLFVCSIVCLVCLFVCLFCFVCCVCLFDLFVWGHFYKAWGPKSSNALGRGATFTRLGGQLLQGWGATFTRPGEALLQGSGTCGEATNKQPQPDGHHHTSSRP